MYRDAVQFVNIAGNKLLNVMFAVLIPEFESTLHGRRLVALAYATRFPLFNFTLQPVTPALLHTKQISPLLSR